MKQYVLSNDSRPTDRLVAKLAKDSLMIIDDPDGAYERQLAAFRAADLPLKPAEQAKPPYRDAVDRYLSERVAALLPAVEAAGFPTTAAGQGESATADAVSEAAEPQVSSDPAASAEPTIEDLVISLSRASAARYAGFATFEDVQQELQLFILENAAQIARWYNNSGFHRVALALRGAAKRYCETEKAAASGYSFDDVAWYDPTMLEDLIPLALDEKWDGTSPSSEDDDSMPRSKRDAAVGGTLLAMVMDVRRAIRRVGSSPTAVAEFLGGDFPGSRSQQKTPRRVLSNAAAAAAISSEVSN